MTRHAAFVAASMLALTALAGCSNFKAENVPPSPEGLEYPSVADPAPRTGQKVLTPEERRALESDLGRYGAAD